MDNLKNSANCKYICTCMYTILHISIEFVLFSRCAFISYATFISIVIRHEARFYRFLNYFFLNIYLVFYHQLNTKSKTNQKSTFYSKWYAVDVLKMLAVTIGWLKTVFFFSSFPSPIGITIRNTEKQKLPNIIAILSNGEMNCKLYHR